jgi:SPP1 gp7 family putative phage head morphogenesis protein
VIDISNETGRQQYHAYLDNLWLRLRASLQKKADRLIKRQFRESARLVENGIFDTDDIVDQYGADLKKMLEIHYRRVMQVSADESAKLIEQAKILPELSKRTMGQDFWSAMARFINDNTAGKVTQINGTTKRNIQKIIRGGINEGLSSREMAKKIREVSGISTAYRAKMIARTETHGAYNYATDKSVEATGIPMLKIWSSAINERTRKPHLKANKQKREQAEAFLVWDEALMRPGDPDGSAKNIINCRCAVLYRRKKVVSRPTKPKPIAEVITAGQVGFEGYQAGGQAFIKQQIDPDLLKQLDEARKAAKDLKKELKLAKKYKSQMDQASARLARMNPRNVQYQALKDEVTKLEGLWESHLQEYESLRDFNLFELERPIGQLRHKMVTRTSVTENQLDEFHRVSRISPVVTDESVGNIEEFIKMTNGKGTRTTVVDVMEKRAQSSGTTVDIGYLQEKNAIFHEMAHVVEEVDIDIRQAALHWRNNRAKGNPKLLRDLTGDSSYGLDEIAVSDDFFDPYIGRVYQTRGEDVATEVVSMSLEAFHSERGMADLLLDEPDLFDFAIGVMKK